MIYLGVFLILLGPVYGQMRYHKPHQDHAFNYSFINVHHVKGYKMIGAEPISSISTPNRTQCHRECLLAIDKCKSINVAEKPKGFECETMPVDIYTGGVLVEDADSTHYIIASECLNNPCAKGEHCIPSYINNTFGCYETSCVRIKQKHPTSVSGYYKILINKILESVYCDMDTDGGGWMMIGNYSYADGDAIPPPNFGKLSSFDQLRTGNFLLESNLLSLINKSSPIQQIRIFCHRPNGDKKAHFATAMNELGFKIRDSIIKGEYIKIEDPNFHKGLEALTGDYGGLSSKANVIRGDIYDHSVFIPGQKHIIIRGTRRDCDDVKNSHSGGIWNFYVR